MDAQNVKIRDIDVATIKLSPQNRTKIHLKDEIEVEYSIKNLGVDTIYAFDSIDMIFSFKEAEPNITSYEKILIVLKNSIIPGDSIILKLKKRIDLNEQTGFYYVTGTVLLHNNSSLFPIEQEIGFPKFINNEWTLTYRVLPKWAISESILCPVFNIYPNPAKDKLNISVPNRGFNDLTKVTLLDMYSKICVVQTIDSFVNLENYMFEIPSELKNGLYWIVIVINDEVFTRKILIQK
ncbi:MAG: T9SS type A sorting domain-containing protein [Bacteroidetes bacterium]|nr:T9SS type A sorting domain-containing protein [Bacteroidota bacterium]